MAFDDDINTNFKKAKMAIESLKTSVGGNGGRYGIPPSPCKNLKIERGGSTNTLFWEEPDDTIINGFTLSTWGKTIIVRKLGDYPTDETDGDVVVTNTEKNQYATSGFADAVDASNSYNYTAFPVSVNGAVCYDTVNRFDGGIEYEFSINQSNSYPYGMIEYHGRNANFKPMAMDYDNGVMDYGDWKDTFLVKNSKPCMLTYAGAVDYYLNPDDLTLKLDGTPSDIADTTYGGNGMIQKGQTWMKIYLADDGRIHVKLCNKKKDKDYRCFTHYNKDNKLLPYIYKSLYYASNINNVYRSISGQPCADTLSSVTMRSRVQANLPADGTGDYDLIDFSYHLTRLMKAYMLGHSTNTQLVFGAGRNSGGTSSKPNQLNTGGCNQRGQFGGDNNNGTMVFDWEQDIIGNEWEPVMGLMNIDGVLKAKLTPGTVDGSTAVDYNFDGTGYITSGVDLGTATIDSLYFSKLQLCKTGDGNILLPVNVDGGSATTKYCDGLWSAKGTNMLRVGGGSYCGALGGLSALSVHYAPSFANWNYGASLLYKPA